MTSQDSRDLVCPYCGYRLYNDTGIGARYCGPHVNSRGEHTPAVRMRTLRASNDETQQDKTVKDQ